MSDAEKIKLVHDHDCAITEVVKAVNSSRWNKTKGVEIRAEKATKKLLAALLGREATQEECEQATYG